MKILEMKEGTNNIYLLIKGILEKETKGGKKYLVTELTDGDTTISAKIWDTSKEIFLFEPGDVFYCQIKVGTYNDAPDYTVVQYRKIKDDEANINDFIETPPIEIEKMYAELLAIAERIPNAEVRVLSTTLWKNHKNQLLLWSAAMKMHHNLKGGLLYHTYRMVQMAENTMLVYANANVSYLIAGCLLHDIGKLVELDTTELGAATYTVDGTLLGHLLIGSDMIAETGKNLGLSDEVIRNMRHIVVSHHGLQEYGAIVKPSTLEAYLVSELDMIDSKVYQFEKAVKDIEPGQLSERVFGIGNVTVYKPVK